MSDANRLPSELTTVVGRATCAMIERLQEIGLSDNWISEAAEVVVIHVIAELLCHECDADHPLTYGSAIDFLQDDVNARHRL